MAGFNGYVTDAVNTDEVRDIIAENIDGVDLTPVLDSITDDQLRQMVENNAERADVDSLYSALAIFERRVARVIAADLTKRAES